MDPSQRLGTPGARHRRVALSGWLACIALAGCIGRASAPQADPLSAPPIDAERAGSVEQAMAWTHRRTLAADLDGDGAQERIALAADVQSNAQGAPLWEDGHRWALWAEGQGRATLLYSAFVPNGHAEVAVLSPDARGRRHLLVQERAPHQVRALVVAYEGPGRARGVSAAHYQVERWMAPLATAR